MCTKGAGVAMAVAMGVAMAVVMASVASPAAAQDALTERTRGAAQQQRGADFTGKLNYGCMVKRLGGEVRVRCGEGEAVTLIWDFEVLAAALDFRTRLKVETVTAGDPSIATTSGTRQAERAFQAYFKTYGEGTYVISSVKVRYRVARAYDDRECVTAGEWARVDPDRGAAVAPLRRVTDVFDDRGRRTLLVDDPVSGDRYQVREYARCGSSRTREVTFVQYDGGPWDTYWDDYPALGD